MRQEAALAFVELNGFGKNGDIGGIIVDVHGLERNLAQGHVAELLLLVGEIPVDEVDDSFTFGVVLPGSGADQQAGRIADELNCAGINYAALNGGYVDDFGVRDGLIAQSGHLSGVQRDDGCEAIIVQGNRSR